MNLPALIGTDVPGCAFPLHIEDGRVFRTDTGEVAVLYSPGFGAGWCSWDAEGHLSPFEPAVVLAVLSDQRELLTEAELGDFLGLGVDDYVYTGGAKDLEVTWLPKGTPFEIREYDGNEHVQILAGPPPYVA